MMANTSGALGFGEAVLTIAMSTERPIDLEDFAESLGAWQTDYAKFYAGRFPDHDENEARLLIRGIRSGSILVDVIPILAPFISDMENIKTIIEYVDAVRTKVLPWLKIGGRNPHAPVSDLVTFHQTIAAIAKDSNGSLELRARFVRVQGSEGELHSEFAISSDEAKVITQNIEAEQIERREIGHDQQQQVVMYLHQASLDEAKAGKRSGEKGIIESISDKPLKLVYASDLAGQRIKSVLYDDDNPLKKAFVVDVNVETVRGKPFSYRITNVHSVESMP